MAQVPSEKLYVQLPATQTRAPVGEGLEQTIAGDCNFLLDTCYLDLTFTMNGFIKSFNGKTGIDGIKSLRIQPTLNWEIFDVVVYGEIMGSSGTTEFDILYSTFPAGSWTSIFNTRPQITSAAPNNTTIGIGDTVSGAIAPVLISTPNPLLMTSKTRFRMDIYNVQGGKPENFGLTLYLRGTN